MAANIDRRFASAILLFVTGVSAVILVEKEQSRPVTLAATLGQPLLSAPREQSLLPDVVGATATTGWLRRRGRTSAWLLPGAELCR